MPTKKEIRSYDILVVDDEQDVISVLKEYSSSLDDLKFHGCYSAQNALSWAQTNHFDIALIDYKLPRMDGLELAKTLMKNKPESYYLIMTGYADTEIMVKAIRNGIFDFFCKPVRKHEFEIAMRRVIKHLNLKDQNSFLHDLVQSDSGRGQLIGQSKSILSVKEKVKLFAQSDAPVLITGETGVGKEIVAQMIHAQGNRHKSPFMPVNCSAFAETLLESELFGHEKGAFTGAYRERKGRLELAGHGTVFLDELCEIPTQMQVKLLRVLQERLFERVGGSNSVKLKARVISATNRSVKEEVEKNFLRKDFFYRLNTHRIHISPLRERKEDVEILALFFLKKYSLINNKQVSLFCGNVIDVFFNHPWPGNVRQLENVVNTAVLHCDQDRIGMEHLPEEFLEEKACQHPQPVVAEEINSYSREHENIPSAISNLERKKINDALTENKWNKSKTAESLGLTRSQLLYRLKKYNIE